MLTISQLAAYTGVTVRAIRHYHQRGLLPEPPRDRSGYRRYDSSAVITFTRIKALGQAGVPLSRIPALLDAGPGELGEMIPELDAALRHRIEELEDTRLRLRALSSGERVYATEDIAAHLDRLADLGLTPEQVDLERDMWSLLLALYPRHTAGCLSRTTELLNDPEIAELYVEIHAARDLSPDDPKIDMIARRAVELAQRAGDKQDAGAQMRHDTDAFRVVDDHGVALSPAWLRLAELGRNQLRNR